MMESVKAFSLGAIVVLLLYSVPTVYVLNMYVHLRSFITFRSLVLAELLLIGFGSFGAHLAFAVVGEPKSFPWATSSGGVFSVLFGIALPSYTPFLSFVTDSICAVIAVILGAVLSAITTLVGGRASWDK